MSKKRHKFCADAGPSNASFSENLRRDLPPPPPRFSVEEWTRVFPGLNERRRFVKQEPDL